MTFVYPAVFTPKKDGKGYDAYFPDLECCEADGPDLEDAIEDLRRRFGKKSLTYAGLLGNLKMPDDGRDSVRMPGLMYQ